MHKRISLSLWLTLGCLALFLLLPLAAFAEVQTVEADGYYTVGDGAEENFSVARERAKADAMKRAAEQAAVYVEAFTEVKNHKLTASEVRTLAAKVLSVETAAFENTAEGNVFKIRCHVVARVKEDEALVSILSNRQELEESLQREREKDAKIAELNREMEELKRQYQDTKTDGEQERIRREAKRNDAIFTATQLIAQGLRENDKKEFDKAIEYYNKAIALVPNYALAYNNLGIAYRKKGEYNRAIECYNKAIAINPNYTLAYFNLGNANVHMRQYDKAVEFFNKVITIDPNFTYKYRVYSNIGAAYYLKGENYNAADWFGKAIELNPKDAKLHYNRGQAYVGVREYKKAKLDFAKAYELDPNDPRIAKAKRISENW